MVEYVKTEEEISKAIKKEREIKGRAIVEVRSDCVILLNSRTFKPMTIWMKND